MLTDKVARYFSTGARTRGNSYFAARRVRNVTVDSLGWIDAQVRGSQDYTVLIDIDSQPRSWTLYADCSCPYADGNVGFCKHLWATLLALESEDHLEDFGPVPAVVRLTSLDGDEDGNDVDAWPWADEPSSDPESAPVDDARGTLDASPARARHAPPKARAVRPATPPAWLRMLQYVYPAAPKPLPLPKPAQDPLEPIYVLEIEDSAASGNLVTSLAQQKLSPKGKLGKLQRVLLSPAEIKRIANPADRTICLMLMGAGVSDGPSSYYRSRAQSRASSSSWAIPAELHDEVLPLLFATGRFRARQYRGEDAVPLVWDQGAAWELVLAVTHAAQPGGFVLEGRLSRGEEHVRLADVNGIIRGAPGWLVHNGVLSRLDLHGCDGWIQTLRLQKTLPFQKKDFPLLLKELDRLQAFPPIQWPPDWQLTEVTDLVPQPELELQVRERQTFRRERWADARIRFHYGDLTVDGLAAGRLLADTKVNRLIRRKPEQESTLVGRVMNFGAKYDRYESVLEVPLKRIPDIVASLLAEGWTVLGDRKLYRRPGNFKLNVSSGVDWFELQGHVDFDGQTAELPELLAALRKGERFVHLGDGSLGMLPEQWLAQHRLWLELGHPEDDHLRFAKTQLGLLDALLAEMPQVTFDANLAAARRKLSSFAGIQPRPEPAGFTGQLREYQREGLGWLHFLREFGWGGCLADDMGLGKTVQLLALLADRSRNDSGPALVVAPKSVVFNWAREAERFAPRLRVLNYTGLERRQLRDDLDQSDLVLTTYGTLRRDIEFLRSREFSYAVLDEAQAVKNPDSQSAKAVRLLRAGQRLVLTGTPVENHLGDLWSLFEFLNPGMLGSVQAFKDSFGNGRASGEDPPNLPLLQRILRPFILRRTKDQVAPELPARSEQTIVCELGPRQSAYYKELRDHYRASLLARVAELGLARSKIHVLEALLRLRQAACHPGLIDESRKDEESAKLESLLAMITELVEEGHKALVFSQFTTLLGIVRAELDRRGVTYEYLDGRTRDRARCIDRFQNDPTCPLFLISLKAGGVGLNLTAADYVFILDPWWNPAVEAQAIDRTHRIGQDKKVIAYRLIARDTVEEKILELQKSKRQLADAIITEHNSVIRDLTREDLALLLS